MIESCSFKRMVLLITSLVCLCLVILVVESMFTPAADKSPQMPDDVDTTQNCWKVEMFTITQHCEPCSEFEKVSKHLPACLTGYKEQVSCEKTGLVYRSCKVPSLEQKKFWIFECAITGIGVISAFIVIIRQKQLDRRMVERIQQQISAGV